MHISDVPNTILTKCSKMKEEHEAIHGMNGNSDVHIKEECPKTNYVQGGRLKFFKDGKFILELERAREGERVSWVSVPRKTFWPPQGTAASTPTYRQESSTSLSVSDDNSSIQSSPWQRDHSWKQTTPRRNASKQMAMMYWRPRRVSARRGRRSRKRRRPYCPGPDQPEESSAGRVTSVPKKEQGARGAALLAIVQSLIDRNCRTSTPPRSDMVVSPRKRFLREMEKDRGQVDDSCLKRSRSRPQTAAVTPCLTPPASVGAPIKTDSPPHQRHTPPSQINGSSSSTTDSPVPVENKIPPPVAQTAATTPRNCSYSITSLLAEDHHQRGGGDKVKGGVGASRDRNTSPSHYASPPLRHFAPPPDDRWYTESVDKLRSIELSHVDKRGFHPAHPPPSVYAPHHHPHAHAAHHSPASFLPPPYLYQYAPMPTSYYAAAAAAGVYGRVGYGLPPPGTALYHHSAPPPPPVQLTHAGPPAPAPQPWMAPRSNTVPFKEAPERRDEITDMPLNLSKHAG
ncbi:E3 ubiquitin-protein ligase Hakai isoform X2 [Aethina tumida]|uniref:E3 ubiquitin-protein ligase Hakai isoform X2 n=1 Tax=Aethina tumida TaxID=116153 RepID=UPI0021478644|nr:E3 ubiquitin-protein ligase Hakai isoform X2 [Aethina tumida]